MNIIELKNITLSFSGETLLNNLSWQVSDGDAWAVIGPSGQGKSSVLKVIAGLVAIDSGSCLFSPQNLANSLAPISMLFQKNALFDSMTVIENIAFPLIERGVKPCEAEKLAKDFLKEVGLEGFASQYPEDLSGGMQKRLGIARSMALRPKLLLYDDPTAGLDPITSREIAKLIRQEQKKNKMTIISVTNDMVRAYQLADKFLFVMNKEALVFSSKEEIISSDNPYVYQFIRGETAGPING